MAKSTRNSGSSWADADVSQIKRLARQQTPTREIARTLGRTEAAIRSRAQKEGISLRAAGKRPAAARKKR